MVQLLVQQMPSQHTKIHTTEFIVTPAYRCAQWLTISGVSIMVNCKMVCFYGGLFADP